MSVPGGIDKHAACNADSVGIDRYLAFGADPGGIDKGDACAAERESLTCPGRIS